MAEQQENNEEAFRDRLLRVALQENLGGESPPDLVDRVLEAQVTPKVVAVEENTPRKRWLTRYSIAAIAATLLVGVTLLLLPSVQSARKSAKSQFKVAKIEMAGDPLPSTLLSLG